MTNKYDIPSSAECQTYEEGQSKPFDLKNYCSPLSDTCNDLKYLLFEFQIDIVTTDTVDLHTHLTSGGAASKDEESTQNTTVLLRMGPYRCENLPDILVECPISHPFFVKDKGKAT